jgi:flagellar hook protein FlgE
MYGTILSGMSTAMSALGVISNNIANSSSTAFQKSDTTFADLFSNGTPESASRNAPGLGSMLEGTRRSQAQGNLMEREGVLNLGLSGNGMFVMARPDGNGGVGTNLAYTRVGEFSLDAEGFIRSNDGSYLLGVPGEGGLAADPSALQSLQIAPTEQDINLTGISIARDGKVVASYGSDLMVDVGQISIATFPNPMGLRNVSQSRFEQTVDSGEAALGIATTQGFASINSGKLESSNVDLTTELTIMLRAQQQFSGAAKLLQTNSDMLEKLTR